MKKSDDELSLPVLDEHLRIKLSGEKLKKAEVLWKGIELTSTQKTSYNLLECGHVCCERQNLCCTCDGKAKSNLCQVCKRRV